MGRLGRVMAVTVATAAAVVSWSNPAFADVRSRQWHLEYLHIPDAQQISTGTGVTVAVVDTGVDGTNPDLQGQLLPGTSMGSAVGLPANQDANGHGTSTAGLIAAKGDGANRPLGIAPGAKVLPVRADIAKDGQLNDGDVASGIRWAADHGARVINVSWGHNGDSVPAEKAAVSYAQSKDIVVVASAGSTNEGISQIASPAHLPGVISVTGLDQNGQFWSQSAQGAAAVLCAPAVQIYSTDILGAYPEGYSSTTGTSDSAAIVSGVVALLRSKYPSMSSADVINHLINTADNPGVKPHNTAYGFGIVDPVKALTANVPHVEKNPLGAVATASPSANNSSKISKPSPSVASGISKNAALIAIVLVPVVALALALVAVLSTLRRRRQRSAPENLRQSGEQS